MQSLQPALLEMLMQVELNQLLSQILQDEHYARKSLQMVPSENSLSPLAQLPFLLQAHGRYFLNDYQRFNTWFFPGGQQFERIEKEWLLPLLSKQIQAQYVNIRPISGMNCMTVMLAALTEVGDTLYSIAPEYGGHVSTAVIAKRFGLQLISLPFFDTHTVNLEQLREMLLRDQPRLIYLDQSTFLFPLDPWPIRQLVDEVSPATLIYYDSSHANGLIIGGAMFNPLERGADALGGSTHKTLPGPHKAFVATNNAELADLIEEQANHFVSHHHPSSVISLLMTLLEMQYCRGDVYAKQIIVNAKVFASTLDSELFLVAASEQGYTACHQVWAATKDRDVFENFSTQLMQSGIIINQFNALPGIPQPALRLSLAELTRYGFDEAASVALARLFNQLAHGQLSTARVKVEVEALRDCFAVPQYCFSADDMTNTNQQAIDEVLSSLRRLLVSDISLV